MIRHHPSEATLLRGAAGLLPVPHARVLSVHAAHCADCTAALRDAEAIGGGLLETLAPAPLAADALARALAGLDAAPLDAPQPDVPAPDARTPFSLAGLAQGRWRWTGPGIAMMPLIRRDETDSRLDLIRVAPGVALLEHGHTGFELTCVLQGGFDDGTGAYHVGDLAEGDAALHHRPLALAGEDCICLIATSGRLRPRGLLGWLVRPLLGM